MLLAQAIAAHAYVLPAEQILTFMIKKLGSARTLMVAQKTVLFDPDLRGGLRELQETLYYRYPDRFRSEVRTRRLEQIRVVNQDGALMVVNGEIVAERERAFDHFKDPLLYRETGLLIKRLSQLGINLQVVSLGRFNNKICYVIGGKYPDESGSQVWIDKETFRPVRLILEGEHEDAPLRAIEYSHYTGPEKGITYPASILFFENGTLVRMHVLETMEVDPHVSEELFDVAYLKGEKAPMVPDQSTSWSAPEPGDVKEAIVDLEEMFE
jgi:hypothetical protein